MPKISLMMMTELYLKEESYKIIGICMEVHKILGKGHSEKVYGGCAGI